MRRETKRTCKLLLAATMVLALAGCTAETAVTPTPAATTNTATPTPTTPPEPTYEPVRIAVADADVASWKLAPPEQVAEVRPAVGNAADGKISVVAYAPATNADEVTLMSTTVSLKAGETYKLRYRVRAIDDVTVARDMIRVSVGGVEVPAPTFTATDGWADVEGSVDAAIAGPGEQTLKITLRPPKRRVAFDSVSLTDAGGAELVPNGSFEDVAPTAMIASSSLVLSTAYASLAFHVPKGPVKYSVHRGDETVLEGTLEAQTSLEALPLDGLPQGYYELQTSDASGTNERANFALVDTEHFDLRVDKRFGVGTHVENPDVYGDAAFRAANLGIGSLRNDVTWSRNEKAKGVYEFDSVYTSTFDQAAANGVDVLAIIDYSNRLYGDRKAPDTPTAIAAYGRYAAAVVDQLGPSTVEVYNEFNHPPFNDGRCGRTPKCYLPLVKSVSDSVRGLNRGTKIIVGATANYESTWFEELWRLGAQKYADAMSFHPYVVNSKPELMTSLIADAREVSKAAGRMLPVSITETGTSTKRGGRSLPDQARLFLKIQAGAFAAGADSVYWYDLVNDSADAAAHEGNFGLYKHPRSQAAALEPKPAALAAALMTQALSGREPTLSVADSGVVAHRFGSDTSGVYVAWAPSGKATFTVDAVADAAVVDAFGRRSDQSADGGKISVPLTTSPVLIYLEGAEG